MTRARGLVVLRGPAVADAEALLPQLESALAGSGPALLPVADGAAGEAALAAADTARGVTGDVALLLATSGSTGEPKIVELTAKALLASASATHERLGGPGRWLLSLPLVHVAGWQVLVRSLAAGSAPVVADPGDTAALADAVAQLASGSGGSGARRYASLVPTQLARALADPAATAALAVLDAVLLGGAAAPSALLALARANGVNAVTTYGSTETCGGCVYDGVPLAGARVALDGDGRILLGGASLARGYRRPVSGGFTSHEGMRWFATDDVGELDDVGRLAVLGRRDDVLVTGGRKVAPAAVEAVLGEVSALAAVCVVGVPDDEWGQRVVALAAAQPGLAPPSLEAVRALVSERLGPAAAPRELLVVDAIPLRGIGKPDRVAATALATRLLAHDLR